MTKQSLISDLAALIVKHKASEWSELFRLMRETSGHLEMIETEILRLSALPKPKPKARKTAAKASAQTKLAFGSSLDAERKSELSRVVSDIAARRVLRTTALLADFYRNIGGSLDLPASRQRASQDIGMRLAKLSDAEFDRAVEIVRTPREHESKSLKEDYEKWTNIISRTRLDKDTR